MASIKHFRSAFSGFHREDVVRYIEYINNKHNSEMEQLKTQLQDAKEALEKADNAELQAKLEVAEARCAELEAQLSAEKPAPVSTATPNDELEVYRRAERAERLARDRAALIYAQANAALADVTVKVEALSDNVNSLCAQFDAKLQEGKNQLQDAVVALYAIRPEEE